MKTEFLLDYPTILANQGRPVHFAIRFRAEASSSSTPRPQPVAFCLVLDRSGSMSGEPLAKAKEAARVAVRHLRPEDLFGLVVFDDAVQTLIPLQSAGRKGGFLNAISQVESGGSTNLTGGWMLGRDELRKAPDGTQRRLLLLSDGQLNQGIVDPPAVRHVVASGLEQDRVRTSCLGFGDAYNEDLMADLARATNGQFYDADSPEKFPGIFTAELDGLQKLAVANLRLRLKALDFCDGCLPLGEYPSVRLPDGRLEIALGDLVAEEERILCSAVQVLALPWSNGQPAASLEGEPLLEVEVLWDEMQEQGIVSRKLTQRVCIQATQDPAQVVANGEVIPWVTLQKAGVVMVEATRHLDHGDSRAALAGLDQAMSQLGVYGERAAEALEMLRQMKRKLEEDGWSARERKSTRFRSDTLQRLSSAQRWTLDEPPPSFKAPPATPPDEPDATGQS